MNYYLYKLRFDTSVHFGPSSALSLYSSDDHFCADTLFSALCHTALSTRGPHGLEVICNAAQDGSLLLSDAMPWADESFYLPKPFMSGREGIKTTEGDRKTIKKLKWIPIEHFEAFNKAIRDGQVYDAAESAVAFGSVTNAAKVQIRQGEDALPYQVGLYTFRENAGLWVIVGCETEELEEELAFLMTGLGLTGIGGKTSSGYGKFHLDDRVFLNEPFDDITEWLLSSLNDDTAEKQLLLTSSLPSDETLKMILPDAEYMLTRRSGFIYSENYSEVPGKKKTQFFLAAGSVLPSRFDSVLYVVGEMGNHPAYRFSGPIMMGVKL